MEPTTQNSSKASSTPKSGTRSAELPDDFGKPDPAPDTTENEESSRREDREAVPPVHRGQVESLKDEQEDHAEENIPEKLARWEKPIDKYREVTLEAAPYVARITEKRLHRERGYDSIGKYADERFGISRQRWYQLAACGEVLDQLRSKQQSTAVDTPLPSNEAQTRPLQSYRGDEDFLWKAWTKAVEEFGPTPRRTDVKDIVDELTSEDSESDSSGEEKTSGEQIREESEGEDSSASGSERAPSSGENSSLKHSEDGDTDANEDSDEEPTDGDPEPENPEGSEDTESSETTSGKSEEGSSDEETSDSESSGGFAIDLPEDVSAPQASGSSCDQSSSPTKEAIEDLAQKAGQKDTELSRSSTEHMVASKVWKVLVPSPIGVGAGLPEEASAKEDPVGAVLKPGRLDQITDLAPGHDGERVLVCPGVDLFGEVVPDGAVEAILSRCRKTDHKPVVFTRHLSRASDFDLSGLWVGTPADHSCLDDKAQALSDAAPDAAVKWFLYDIAKTDREDPPSFSGETDWVVYDPPGGAGVSLYVDEMQALIEAAEESGVDWSFRAAFKTCGDSGPSQEDADEDTD